MKLLSLFCKTEQGGGLVEYALITALIALAAVTAITTVGTKVSGSFTSISSKL
ncbi:MAG: Flp/Fap pilin component [Alphaproteobacteria bacterium]|jgi:pilus assembly protein Flp/PilA|nr:Flp/Fap pilin component [Alphaproteobacteria bacterium]MDF3033246.1 Flp/Fap pilin component [Alphaproteobacteria bacterium]